MNNPRHWASSVNNNSMIHVFMTFYTILGCVVFNLISTPCKSDEIWSIILIRRIDNRFVRKSSQLLNKSIDTLKTLNIRYHSFFYKALWCVTNVNTVQYKNMLHTTKIMSKFTMVFHFWLMESISCQWQCNHAFTFICQLHPKRCINLSKFSSRKLLVEPLYYVIYLINT